MESNWYVVKVLPGKERILKEEYNKQIAHGDINGVIRFICPTEKELKIIRNKKVIREKVIYTGYLYFETENVLTKDELKFLGGLDGLMTFMKDKSPVRLRDNDIMRVLKDEILDNHNSTIKYQYKVGELIKVIDGPFKSFEGSISAINGEKVSVGVKIFGRFTPLELTINQIEKL